MREKSNKNHVALAGEFAVLSRLLLYGYDASITFGNTKGTDILAFHPESKRNYRVEVKTTTKSIREKDNTIWWQMGKKHEEIKDDDLFYCFVSAPKDKNGEFRFFIVPSKDVAYWVKEQCRLYVESGRKADEKMRGFRLGLDGESRKGRVPLAEEYENKWEFKNGVKA